MYAFDTPSPTVMSENRQHGTCPVPNNLVMQLDFSTCYRAIQSRDSRFDGRFFVAVTSTGIYCRPICPAQTPQERNVRFYPSAAAAEAAGFRACRRCRPEAHPGSPDWNVRADLVGRALRHIAEGSIDVDGVDALARRLAVSPRHLHRELVREVGVGPLALARTRRAQTARLLIDGTNMPLGEVAFAAGFRSIRQFNETMQSSFGCKPSELRRRDIPALAGNGTITLRLTHRVPFDGSSLLTFLEHRALSGVEEVVDGRYRRTIWTANGPAVIELEPLPNAGQVLLRLQLEDLRGLSHIVQRCRQLFDLDADPDAVAETLSADETLAPLVAAHPGLRVPGTVDGWELAVRAVLGQQISVAAARTVAGRLVARLGTPLAVSQRSLTHVFPRPEVVADADLTGLGLTGRRVETLRTLARTVAEGTLVLDRGTDREETARILLALPGIGPWTVSYISMRALGDPDAFPSTDLGLRDAVQRLGIAATSLEKRAERWRPWRAYAAIHLWAVPAQPQHMEVPA
jgi:AraC family transcriptional regulator of adaptative response / DNA-3-methyladenine glycosylase II